MTSNGHTSIPPATTKPREYPVDVVPVVPDVSRHRMAMLLYRGYREWVAAGRPKRA